MSTHPKVPVRRQKLTVPVRRTPPPATEMAIIKDELARMMRRISANIHEFNSRDALMQRVLAEMKRKGWA